MNTHNSIHRIYYWDNIKCILIFFVVLAHFLAYAPQSNKIIKGVILFIQTFYMQFFILVNGYFYSKKNVRYKVISYLTIGMILKIVLALISKKVSFNFFLTQNIPWYLFALLAFYIFAYFIEDINLYKILFVNILLFNMVVFDKNVNHMFCLARIIAFFPYFIIGILIKKNQNIICYMYNRYYKVLKVFSVMILFFWTVVCIRYYDYLKVLKRFIPAYSDYKGIEQYFYLKTITFILCIIVIVAIAVLIPKHKLPVVSVIGTRTLQIYFWHTIFRNLLIRFNVDGIVSNNIWIFLSILIFFICSIDIFKYPAELFLPKNIVSK